jgi:hypothetical protein
LQELTEDEIDDLLEKNIRILRLTFRKHEEQYHCYDDCTSRCEDNSDGCHVCDKFCREYIDETTFITRYVPLYHDITDTELDDLVPEFMSSNEEAEGGDHYCFRIVHKISYYRHDYIDN